MTREKRLDFRVFLTPTLKGSAAPFLIGDREVSLEKFMDLSILDLSAGGLRFSTPLDLPAASRITFKILFELEREKFSLLGRIAWKKTKGEAREYGLWFTDLSNADRQRLVVCLNKYEVKKARKLKKQEELLKSRGVEPFLLKMIQLLPFPAYIITDGRQIVAANDEANAARDIRLEEKCYAIICGHGDTCPGCRLDEALAVRKTVKGAIDVDGHTQPTNWLYLTRGLVLHCFL